MPRRPRRLWWILAIVCAFILGLVLGGVGGLVGGATVAAIGTVQTEATPATATSADPTGTLDTTMPTEEPAAGFEYTADTFTIELKTLSKECFGSAGCNLRVKPVLSTFDDSIPDDASGSLTYEITGGEDGPVTDTITLTGTKYSIEQSVISTPSSSKKLKIKITDVETNG